MPIWCYAVEHPDGVFVVDAGASPSYNDARTWRRIAHSRGDQVVHQTRRLYWADPARPVGGRRARAERRPRRRPDAPARRPHGTVPDFQTDIWTTRAEDAAASRIGALHWRWRDSSTRIRYVDAEGSSGDLGPTVALTDDGALTAVHTPGHTPGSVTVRLRTNQTDISFTGDTAFTAAGMSPGRADRGNPLRHAPGTEPADPSTRCGPAPSISRSGSTRSPYIGMSAAAVQARSGLVCRGQIVGAQPAVRCGHPPVRLGGLVLRPSHPVLAQRRPQHVSASLKRPRPISSRARRSDPRPRRPPARGSDARPRRHRLGQARSRPRRAAARAGARSSAAAIAA